MDESQCASGNAVERGKRDEGRQWHRGRDFVHRLVAGNGGRTGIGAGERQPFFPPPGGGAMTSVLVVDDDEASRTAIRRVLEAEGFEVTAAASGYAAVTALETTLFDAVIFDAAAPGL